MAEKRADHGERPERVVIVDADDPMREVHGDFVWRDEHERVLTEARQEAYAEGYSAAQAQMANRPSSIEFRLRPRRTVMGWLELVVIVVLVLFVLLMLPVVLF